jgi:hypothetical protein
VGYWSSILVVNTSLFSSVRGIQILQPITDAIYSLMTVQEDEDVPKLLLQFATFYFDL